MNLVGLFVPLMKVSVMLFSVSTLFVVLGSINGIDRIKGKIVKQRK